MNNVIRIEYLKHLNQYPEVKKGKKVIDSKDLGIILMNYEVGINIMAKQNNNSWEFGYSEPIDYAHDEPFITLEPHTNELIEISDRIQNHFGFKCEIEYVTHQKDGRIYVVQVRDISKAKNISLEKDIKPDNLKDGIRLDVVRYVRKPESYRERPTFVINENRFRSEIYQARDDFDKTREVLSRVRNEYEEFVLANEDYAITIINNGEIERMLHYPLDKSEEGKKVLKEFGIEFNIETCDLNTRHTGTFYVPLFKETDTIVKCFSGQAMYDSHRSFGIDNIRTPLMLAMWRAGNWKIEEQIKNTRIVTGDRIGIEIDDDYPILYKL